MPVPALELKNISKAFGPIRALDGVSLRLEQGEVMAIVGDNAAGKSTLVKIAVGAEMPDSGEILVEGRPVRYRGPYDARKLGIDMVYQDLALFEQLDVAANVYIGREEVLGRFFLNKKAMWSRASHLIDELQVDISSPRTVVRQMSGGQRQMVAICRAVAFGSRIIVLDEPTAALGVRESAAFLQLLQQLRGKHSMILITQRLTDVFDIANKVFVLKGGRAQGMLPVAETDLEEIERLIVGGADSEFRRHIGNG